MTSRTLTDAGGKTVSIVDVGGFLMPKGIVATSPEQTKAFFDSVPDFRLRDDDIMMLSYPKTGTNWMHDILAMLLARSSENVPWAKRNKVMTMLEFQPKEAVDALPGPRVINTHLTVRYLPKSLKEKKIKTVLVVRNPKDMMVSFYNHIKGLRSYGYDGTWNDWFPLYMQGETVYGNYWDYLKAFEKAMCDGIGFPLHLIYYEDLKLDGIGEVKKLAKFLDVDADEELCKAIVDKCTFDTMKQNITVPEDLSKKVFNDGFSLLRKGQIGDWKNWFTLAQNEQFHAFWDKEMADCKTFKFTYTQK